MNHRSEFFCLFGPVIRKIIHIDMDAFFASVEQRDFPELQNKAIAVGGGGDRGVVAAASYEARKFGVRSAMAGRRAVELCPHLIFVKPRFEAYKTTSLIIRSVFKEYTDLIEPLSLDEAYLDVSTNKKNMLSATHIAQEIKQKIKEKTALTASAGVSYNKFLAKIASDYDKPDGLYVITPDQGQAFIEKLAIERFHGIGKVTSEKLRKMGVFRGKDLKRFSLEGLTQRFGKSGPYFYELARAIDNRPVVPQREPKSVGAETTFANDLVKKDELKNKLSPLVEKVAARLVKSKQEGKTITLKIKYSDFRQITRSTTLFYFTNKSVEIKATVFQLLDKEELQNSVRLVGCSVSNFYSEEEQKPQLTLRY